MSWRIAALNRAWRGAAPVPALPGCCVPAAEEVSVRERLGNACSMVRAMAAPTLRSKSSFAAFSNAEYAAICASPGEVLLCRGAACCAPTRGLGDVAPGFGSALVDGGKLSGAGDAALKGGATFAPSSARRPSNTISRKAAGFSRSMVCASCARAALACSGEFPAAPKYARSISSSTPARSAAARASFTPPGYNSFNARASSGVANAARYAAASCLACWTPFHNSRASSPRHGSFICAASHAGGSTES